MRPTASNVVYADPTRLGTANSPDVPSHELAGLVIDAGRRGFSRWRVATALGISARGLASIEKQIGVTAHADGSAGDGHADARTRQRSARHAEDAQRAER